MKSVCVLVALATLFCGSCVRASDYDWSFEQNPHPRKYQYSSQQKNIWQKAVLGRGRVEDICEDVLEASYEIYKLHYPAFNASERAFEARWQQAWRHHLVIDGYHAPTICMVNTAHGRILELLNHVGHVGFRFCGNLATQPRTFDEDYLAAGLDQMLTLASRGVPEAIVNVLYYSAQQPNLTLNPDIEYYLRRFLRKSHRFEEHWGVMHLNPQFARSRLALVERAIREDDFALVLETTAPCSPLLP